MYLQDSESIGALDRLRCFWHGNGYHLRNGGSREASHSTTDDVFLSSVQAFAELRQQIRDLATNSRSDTLDHPLPEDLMKHIPSDFPIFLLTNNDSIDYGACLIMSVTSSILQIRIFEPFLLTLRKDHREATGLLQTSRKLHQASPREEAAWRQQTLRAAYTSPYARETVNNVAASIVDQIISTIDVLIDVKRRKELLNLIRKIVKTAAESWRYAR